MAGKSPEEQIGVPLPEREEPDPQLEVEQQPEENRPEWLPEKFKDPSEFASSYRNLEAELTRRGEDQRRLEAQVEQLGGLIESLSEQSQPPPPQQNVDAVREQLMAAYEADPIGTIAMLSQQYSNQTFDQRMQAIQQQNQPYQQAQIDQQNQMLAITVDGMMSQRHEDWGELKETVAQTIEADPYLLPEQVIQAGPEATMRALDRVYTQVKAQQILENGNGQSSAAQLKMQAQGLSGSGGRPGQPSDSEREANAIVAAAKNLSYSGFRSGGR
jgi:hypothetical protein